MNGEGFARVSALARQLPSNRLDRGVIPFSFKDAKHQLMLSANCSIAMSH